ncbi:hypothetical protein A3Q56_02603 [Intoshia linei]|uniref:Uncharacterized protein n=1 Tax=Intoshia linei TaxID=1819745 RepID=A0A177B8B4_9BILA|nr:hypothetical protein A3Q56_02603 [Intoshia linei]
MYHKVNAKRDDRNRKRQQIMDVHSADGDLRSLLSGMNIPLSTVFSGDKRFEKLNDEHDKFMVKCIEENCKVSLQEIVDAIHFKFNLSISKVAVSHHLNNLLYTLKTIRHEPENANNGVNKESRNFTLRLLELQSENANMVFMDETNFNLHISTRKGRSQRGERCTSIAAGSRGANIHCIGNVELVHDEIKRGSFRKESAQEWMKNCLRKEKQKYNRPVVVVIDNALVHSDIKSILLIPEFSEHSFLRIGSYSPMLNPIETVWSSVNAKIKRSLVVCLVEVLHRQKNVSMTESRARTLEQLMIESINSISISTCANCIASISRYIAPALKLEDITLINKFLIFFIYNFEIRKNYLQLIKENDANASTSIIYACISLDKSHGYVEVGGLHRNKALDKVVNPNNEYIKSWIYTSGGYIHPKKLPGIVLALKYPESKYTLQNVSFEICLENKIESKYGGANQKWKIFNSKNFTEPTISAFNTNKMDIQITTANKYDICTFNIYPNLEINQMGYCIYTMKYENKYKVCLACSKKVSNTYKVSILNANESFICDYGKNSDLHLKLKKRGKKILDSPINLTDYEIEETMKIWIKFEKSLKLKSSPLKMIKLLKNLQNKERNKMKINLKLFAILDLNFSTMHLLENIYSLNGLLKYAKEKFNVDIESVYSFAGNKFENFNQITVDETKNYHFESILDLKIQDKNYWSETIITFENIKKNTIEECIHNTFSTKDLIVPLFKYNFPSCLKIIRIGLISMTCGNIQFVKLLKIKDSFKIIQILPPYYINDTGYQNVKISDILKTNEIFHIAKDEYFAFYCDETCLIGTIINDNINSNSSDVFEDADNSLISQMDESKFKLNGMCDMTSNSKKLIYAVDLHFYPISDAIEKEIKQFKNEIFHNTFPHFIVVSSTSHCIINKKIPRKCLDAAINILKLNSVGGCDSEKSSISYVLNKPENKKFILTSPQRSAANSNLYTMSNAKPVMLFKNGYKTSTAISVCVSSIQDILEKATNRLKLSKRATNLFRLNGDAIKNIKDIQRNEYISVSTNSKFLLYENLQKNIQLKANWARKYRKYGSDIFQPPVSSVEYANNASNDLKYQENYKYEYNKNSNSYFFYSTLHPTSVYLSRIIYSIFIMQFNVCF